MYNHFLLIAMLLLATITNAQRKCLTEAYQAQLNKNKAYLQEKNTRAIGKAYKNVEVRNADGECNKVVTLPIAVHFFGISDQYKDCAIDAAIKQVQILNDDFAGVNVDKDVNYIASNYPNINMKSPCFRFALANKNHPTGFGLKDGDLAVIFHNQDFETYNALWNDYLNLFVGKIDNGILGYSPLGGWGNGDGVAIGTNFFYSGECGDIGNTTPYNLGRTATHELGHYFLLDHIWGQGCGKDDGVTDTPNQEKPNGGCPINAVSCGSSDLHINYMDYTNDACMYMFTAGQIEWMDEYVFSDLDNLIEKGKKVIAVSEHIISPIVEPVVDATPYTMRTACQLIYRTEKAIRCKRKAEVLHLCNLLGIDTSKKGTKRYYARLAWQVMQ